MANYIDWGVIEYKTAWDRQTEAFERLILEKKSAGYTAAAARLQNVFFCEHPHVYTLGKHGDFGNMLIQEDRLKALNATFFKTDRGGDITYHGYGQLVMYPIIDLEYYNLSLKHYVWSLEEAVIKTLSHFGLSAGRAQGATGVWFDYDTPKARKICAIGVRASHFVTMHGIALNVSTDLSYFNYIHPCGFVDKGVTSLEKELGRPVSINETKTVLQKEMEKLFTV